MLECIKFGDCEIKTIQIEDKWFVSVRHIGIALGVSSGASRVILGSTHPDRHHVIDFLVERHNYLQDQAWKAQNTRHVALDDSIATAKNYRKHIYFVFKLGEPALLGSKRIPYEYTRISKYPWHMKNGIKKFREKHPGSIIILKMVNDPLRVWKKNHSITMF